MSVCTFLPILMSLGGLILGGLTVWAWSRTQLKKLTDRCQMIEDDKVIIWNSYTSLQKEFAKFKDEAERWMNRPKKKTRRILESE